MQKDLVHQAFSSVEGRGTWTDKPNIATLNAKLYCVQRKIRTKLPYLMPMTKRELAERGETLPGLCLKKLYQDSNATSRGRPL